MISNVRFRVLVEGKEVLNETHAFEEDELETVLPQLAIQHASMTGGKPFLVEIEFLDEPKNQRFLRFGTDASGMVDPMEIDLGKLAES